MTSAANLEASAAVYAALDFRLPLIGSFLVAALAYRSRALNFSGAASAVLVGICTFSSGWRATLVLGAFFVTSSIATKVGNAMKISAGLDTKDAKTGRNWEQVAANGAIPSLLCGMSILLDSSWSAILSAGVVAYYACCTGDTWASELGTLSKRDPWLITTFDTVPKGTNGGVSLLGLSASIAGGFLVGILAGLCLPTGNLTDRVFWVLIGTAGGGFGSLIDSFLGAVLQFSGRDTVTGKIVNNPGPNVVKLNGPNQNILTNSMVNVASASTTALIFAILVSNFHAPPALFTKLYF